MAKCYNKFVFSPNLEKKLKKLPISPGVYIYKDNEGKIIYVGKAKNLKNRVSSYFRLSLDKRSKTAALVNSINDLEIIEVETELEALILEQLLIKKHLPAYNINLKDDKSYLYIGVKTSSFDETKKNKRFFSIDVFRKADISKYKKYFGPFPDGGTVKQLLRMLRKAFPYMDCSYTKFNRSRKMLSPCLYGHLRLCPAPCVYDDAAVRENNSNIGSITKILSGDASRLIKRIEKQMKSFSDAGEYELAAKQRDILRKFDYVRQQFRTPDTYLENPYLLDDLASQALSNLGDILDIKESPLSRIECYDISNISGKFAVGSMVTAVNGRIDKSQYRKFKIRFKNSPDDFAMISEVLYRRLKREIKKDSLHWGLPSLIVLDGGKGQLSAGMDVLTKLNMDIPMIGIAKKLETLVLFKDGKFEEKLLPQNSPGMKLVIALRDESHRFAKKYHTYLRSSGLLGAKAS